MSNNLAAIKHFLAIDSAEHHAAAESWRVLEGALDEILDRFYADMQASVLMPDLSQSEVARLKQSQRKHWLALFAGTFGADFDRRARLIGLKHRQHGVPPETFVLAYMKLLSLFYDVLRTAEAESDYAVAYRRTPVMKLVALDMGNTLAAYGAEVVD